MKIKYIYWLLISFALVQPMQNIEKKTSITYNPDSLAHLCCRALCDQWDTIEQIGPEDLKNVATFDYLQDKNRIFLAQQLINKSAVVIALDHCNVSSDFKIKFNLQGNRLLIPHQGLKVFNTLNGQLLAHLAHNKVKPFIWSPKGNYIYAQQTLGYDSFLGYVWNSNGNLLHSIGHSASFTVGFTRGDTYIIQKKLTEPLLILQALTGEKVCSLKDPEESYVLNSQDPQEKWLITHFNNTKSILYDINNGQLIKTFDGSLHSFSPDGEKIIVGVPSKIMLYSRAFECLHEFITQNLYAHTTFNATGTKILNFDDVCGQLFDLVSKILVKEYENDVGNCEHFEDVLKKSPDFTSLSKDFEKLIRLTRSALGRRNCIVIETADTARRLELQTDILHFYLTADPHYIVISEHPYPYQSLVNIETGDVLPFKNTVKGRSYEKKFCNHVSNAGLYVCLEKCRTALLCHIHRFIDPAKAPFEKLLPLLLLKKEIVKDSEI